MGDLTKNISRHEVKCKCGECDYQTLDIETAQVVQDACTHFEKELHVEKVVLMINSAHRCPKHNSSENVGSSDKSQHIRGNSLDHYIKGVPVKVLHDYYIKKYPNKYGIGLYGTFVHIDTRAKKARWGV